MNNKHAIMAAQCSNAVYADEPLCYEMVEDFVKTKKSFKFFKNKNAEACAFVHDNENIVICFRGTQPAQLSDVAADLKSWQVDSETEGEVHAGFKGELDKLWDNVYAWAKLKSNKGKHVIVTGHSLGAAMATISATRYQPEELFTFGSPRVGGKNFIKNIKCPHYRFMNNNDIVCRIPPAWLGFRHHGEMIYFDRNGNKAPKPTWGDLFYGILNSWKRFKFFDGVVDHGMPNYVKALKKLARVEK